MCLATVVYIDIANSTHRYPDSTPFAIDIVITQSRVLDPTQWSVKQFANPRITQPCVLRLPHTHHARRQCPQPTNPPHSPSAPLAPPLSVVQSPPHLPHRPPPSALQHLHPHPALADRPLPQPHLQNRTPRCNPPRNSTTLQHPR